MPPDPDRVRLATEALARARADAWARGDRPQSTTGSRRSSFSDPERPPATPDAALSPEWSARPRRDDPQPLTTALTGLITTRGWRDRAAVGQVFGNWPQIVGPQLSAHTHPESYNDGELTVIADSDTWAAQVRLLSPQILKRLAEEGAGQVRHLRIRGPSTTRRRNVRPS